MKKNSDKRPVDKALDRHDAAVRANASRGPEGRSLAGKRAAAAKKAKTK